MGRRQQTTDVNSLVKCQEYPLPHSYGGIVDIDIYIYIYRYSTVDRLELIVGWWSLKSERLQIIQKTENQNLKISKKNPIDYDDFNF